MTNTDTTQKMPRLTITFRVEPGCLGPQGNEYVTPFCKQAHQTFQALEADVIEWNIVPRFDKALDEIEFKLQNKLLNQAQTSKYFNIIERSQEETEELLHNKIADLIDEFMDQ